MRIPILGRRGRMVYAHPSMRKRFFDHVGPVVECRARGLRELRGRWDAVVALCAALGLLAAPLPVLAIGPHEVLLLVNARSPDSARVAAAYARLRAVPPANVVALDVPWESGQVPPEIRPDEFERWIWTPALRAARERNVAEHVLAWVYSVDFPFRIQSRPAVSIHGLTFVRNRLPPEREVERGMHASPLFAGPARDGAMHEPQTFDTAAAWLGADMPLPAMSLGYTGPRGNSVDDVLRCLRLGAESDGTRPTGTIWFVTQNDVRSRAREWQFAGVQAELARMGVSSVITNAMPADRSGILGLMTGAAQVAPARVGTFRPGGLAEHFTSLAGAFDVGAQTKLTEWIAAGATASAGTVCEPYAIWTKFPHARVFVHYAAGCTLIESFYQAMRCPLQAFLAGDPLAAPWASAVEGRFDGVPEGVVADPVEIRAFVVGRAAANHLPCEFLLDGRPVGGGGRVTIDPRGLTPGSHTLRAVARGMGTVRRQVFWETKIETTRAASAPAAEGEPPDE